MVCAVALFCALGTWVMLLARRTGCVEFDRILFPLGRRAPRALVGGTFLFFLFGVVVVMLAGAGALLEQTFGVPARTGSAALAALLAAVALCGAQGIITAFSVAVPLLLAAALAVSGLAFVRWGPAPIAAQNGVGNPLLSNWVFSMLSFVSYNMMAAISILVPIAPRAPGERIIRWGILRGTAQLTLIFAGILLPLLLYGAHVGDAPLPMLALAGQVHPALGLVYAVLLLCGMFGSAASCLFGAALRTAQLRPGWSRRPVALALVALALAGSAAGFKNLISVLFPVCGYVSFFAMLGIVCRYVSLKRKETTAGRPGGKAP